MGQDSFGKIKYMSQSAPSLYSGEYTASLTQKIRTPVQRTMPNTEFKFFVDTPQFTLSPDHIYSTFPRDGSSGNYENIFPHIMFQDKTYPWRRQFKKNDKDTPWLALICFREQELPEMKELTIQEFISHKEKDIFHPEYQYHPETGEKETDAVVIMDVPVGTVSDIFPRKEELAYLSHVRVTDMYEKNDALIQQDGYFSTVMTNRFPISTDAGIWNTAVLISVEGCEAILPSVKQDLVNNAYSHARFVVLHHFKFESRSLTYPGFRIIMENLDSQSLHVKSGSFDGASHDAGNLLEKGYVPFTHITRSGEQTMSLYRGPLIPYIEEPKQLAPCKSSDGLILYDPLLGIFDMTYSSAWQLGRLMALKNRSIARLIFEWRRTVMRLIIMRQQNSFDIYDTFLKVFALEIGSSLENEEITPFADASMLSHIEKGGMEHAFMEQWFSH